MWSWASDLLGSTRALSISSAVNFKSTPMTGSKTCKKETSSFLHEIFIKKKKQRERMRAVCLFYAQKIKNRSEFPSSPNLLDFRFQIRVVVQNDDAFFLLVVCHFAEREGGVRDWMEKREGGGGGAVKI